MQQLVSDDLRKLGSIVKISDGKVIINQYALEALNAMKSLFEEH